MRFLGQIVLVFGVLLWTYPLMAGENNLSSKMGDILCFRSGSFEGWVVEGDGTWEISPSPPASTTPDAPPKYMVNSLTKGGEGKTGLLRSPVFTLSSPIQSFSIAGADGTEVNTNDGDSNYILLRAHPDGAVLRKTRPPGQAIAVNARWVVADLIGRQVYLEVVDGNPGRNPRGFGWIGFGDYQQVELPIGEPTIRDDLYGLEIDGGAEIILCRSIPFLALHPDQRKGTRRITDGSSETIPVGANAEAIYLLGMINEGWDYGLAHWGEHPETLKVRNDQIFIGKKIGDLEIVYADGVEDSLPLVIGATAWFVAQWCHGPTHGVAKPVMEPFASRPDYMEVLRRSLKIQEDYEPASDSTRHQHYYLAIKTRQAVIESINIRDNPEVRGKPLVSAVTLATAHHSEKMRNFGLWKADKTDLTPRVEPAHLDDWSQDLNALSRTLYTREEDLPDKVDLIPFSENLEAARIRFLGDRWADMLTNIWTANMELIDKKFDRESGVFHESVPEGPWYGGYSGIGTWGPIGVYYTKGACWNRCSDHYATLAMRLMGDKQRVKHYVDVVDKYLYFYRDNHDPPNGPANDGLNVSRYPKGAPPHWSFQVDNPLGMAWEINEIPGNEEMDGHGATMVGRWVAWRKLGAPTRGWLTTPRHDVYGKSPWDSTRDAAEFICWFMDYTGMDVVFSEGETTGWAARDAKGDLLLVPKGMKDETDPLRIRKNYANSNLYEPYPTWLCCVGLRCSAQIADAVGDASSAFRWRAYADRLQEGMYRLLKVGDHNKFSWRVSPYSVYPSFQDSLVHAWFSIYYDGYDPMRWDEDMTSITRNTLERQFSQPHGPNAVLAMGYGQGWLTKAALLLDDMDNAGLALSALAKYVYDKNMNYVDPQHGIDWSRWLWIIPEGTNIMPDGSWYRIGDLSNGANQGPPLHALEVCAGIDDTRPQDLKIMPRVPDLLTGIEINRFPVLIPEGDGLTDAFVDYIFERPGHIILNASRVLPRLSLRLGPYESEEAARSALKNGVFPSGSKSRVEASGRFHQGPAWWVWIEGLSYISTLEISL